MKSLIVTVLLFSFSLCGFAQQPSLIVYLRGLGEEVSSLDSADIIRVITPDSLERGRFLVADYFKNKKRRLLGSATGILSSPRFDGNVVWYDEGGFKMRQIPFVKGKPTGTGYDFHRNGKVKRIIDYDTGEKSNHSLFRSVGMADFLVKQLFDSLGVEIPMDGRHPFTEYGDGGFKETGAYLDGLRTGKWVASDSKGSSTEEFYEKGQLVSGTLTLAGGEVTRYTAAEKLPEFPGGQAGLAKHIQKNFYWPKSAVDRGVSGRVYLSFVVAKDGTLENIRVVGPLDPEIDKEAVRVLKRSPKWTPALVRGVPVRVMFTLPMSLGIRQ